MQIQVDANETFSVDGVSESYVARPNEEETHQLHITLTSNKNNLKHYRDLFTTGSQVKVIISPEKNEVFNIISDDAMKPQTFTRNYGTDGIYILIDVYIKD